MQPCPDDKPTFGMHYVYTQNHYCVVNYAGTAEEMTFYDQAGDREGAEVMGVQLRIANITRKEVFRGENGRFFTLFILRTAVLIVVASPLLGVAETTGERAFSMWIRFLAGSLLTFVRLPSLSDYAANVPNNFRRERLQECITVLHATEVETTRVWQNRCRPHNVVQLHAEAHG